MTLSICCGGTFRNFGTESFDFAQWRPEIDVLATFGSGGRRLSQRLSAKSNSRALASSILSHRERLTGARRLALILINSW